MSSALRAAVAALPLLVAACGGSSSSPGDPGQGKAVEIVRSGAGYQLLRNGEPYAVHGAGGALTSASLAALRAAGGNSTRTWGADEGILAAAEAQGISVTLGFWELDRAAVLDFVGRHKGDPALLMWALGNEMETRTGDPVALWQQVNALALEVKALDPDHPVITVIAEIGGGKLAQLDRYAPALDAVGINGYGGIPDLAVRVAQSGFARPWLVTEFGPLGWWESPTTSFGAPVEESSTAKAARYLAGWQAFGSRATCLGGYAFLWGDKLEETHTWFGMHLPQALGGDALGPVDAMTFAWTGAWPAVRAPAIGGTAPGGMALVPHGGAGDGTQRTFSRGAQVDASVSAADPGGASLTYAWELRADGGASALPGAVASSAGSSAVLQLPAAAGTYRAFAYVRGAAGHAAVATAVLRAE